LLHNIHNFDNIPENLFITMGNLKNIYKVVAAPSLAVFKARLDGALSTLLWWKMSLPVAWGLELDHLEGPLQPKPFYDFYEGHLYWVKKQRCAESF